jgi:hypothetical protein
MTLFSKDNYEDDGRIMKAARKQQYIMFPSPIPFLDDKLKAELDMKKKEKEKEEEMSDNYCSLKVPIDHTDKESKNYTVQVKILLNYSHSRNPPCAPARTHERTDEPKRPESHPTKECARARVRCLNTEPTYYYCPITLVMS